VIEDDGDGDHRYRGSTLPSLFALDRTGKVIHLHRTADTLSPATNLAYLVLPERLIEEARRLIGRFGSSPPWLSQKALADFIVRGDYNHHLRRVRKVMMDRRDCLAAALRDHFGDVELLGTAAGSSLAWVLPPTLPRAERIVASAAGHGVAVYRPRHRAESHPSDEILLLGCGALEPAEIHRGVTLLASAVAEASRKADRLVRI
jgi:GntR family transcriptional regulator/MocR family aminotransferase